MAKVLLVEDDNNLREIYEARLQAEGYDITSAQDGEQALVVAKESKPDLIISDVMMPKISGFEMLDILRNTEGLKDTKVIMLTALGQAEDRGRADSLGADRYLVKSQVTLEDIVKAAHELLEDQPEPAPEVATTPSAPIAPEPVAVTAAPVVAAPAPTPTPEIAVSAPPAEPTPEPTAVEAPVVQVAPEPVISGTSTPVPDDTTATDDVTQATPATDTPQAPPDSDKTEETVGPELSIPGLTDTVEAPATTTPEQTPETEVSATELPSVPAEPAEPAAPAEVPATEAIEPTAPTDTDSSATEAPSTAEEQATVESQIEDFINNSPAVAPSPTAPDLVSGDVPAPTPQPTNDEIMQESVDTLIASAEEANAPLTTADPAEESTPAAAPAEVTPAPEQPKPITVSEPTKASEPAPSDTSDDGVTIAHKKVLQPINDLTSGPDLNELLSREEAKHIADGTAPVVAVTSDNPVTPATDPVTPGAGTPTIKTTPGHTIIPTTTENSIPPTKKDDFDPNNISL